MNQPKLFIFDVDGTLVEKFSCMFLGGVEEWRAANPDAMCAIATNQGGVGLNYWMKTGGFGNPDAYHDEPTVMKRINKIAELLAIPAERVYVAFRYQSQKTGQWSPTPYDNDIAAKLIVPAHQQDTISLLYEEHMPRGWRKDWRKPQAGMLLAAMNDAVVGVGETVFIGDSVDDRNAARATSIPFINANSFFGRESKY